MATATPARARPPTIIAARAHPVLAAEIRTLLISSVAPKALNLNPKTDIRMFR
jgi:hypothetical protein